MKIKLLLLLTLILFALLMTGCNEERETNVKVEGNGNKVIIYRECP